MSRPLEDADESPSKRLKTEDTTEPARILQAESVVIPAAEPAIIIQAEVAAWPLLVWFDLETTGKYVKSCRIIEIAVHVEDEFSQPVDGVRPRWDVLVNPGIKIPAGATAVNTITNEMVRERPDSATQLRKFMAYLTKLHDAHGKVDVMLTGHNCHYYDAKVLINECNRHGIVIPEFIWFGCTYLAHKIIYPEYTESRKLETMAEKLGLLEGVKQTHRAYGDVLLLQKFVRALDKKTEMFHELFASRIRGEGR